MSQLARAVRLDSWTLRPYVSTYVGVLAALSIMALLLSNPYQLSWPFAFLGMFAPISLFQLTERFHLGVLHAQVPLGRRAIVLSKYSIVWLTLAATPVVGTLLGWLVSIVLGSEFSLVMALGCGAFVSAAVAVVWAVQAPLYFALPYTKARMWTMVPIIILAGGMGMFMSALGSAGTTMWWSSTASLWRLVGFTALGAVVATAVSVTVSLRFYDRRDL